MGTQIIKPGSISTCDISIQYFRKFILYVLPFGEGKFSQPFPTGVAGSDSEAWTAESIFSQSRVGELGADFLVTSCCLSRTASSCLKSVNFKKFFWQTCIF